MEEKEKCDTPIVAHGEWRMGIIRESVCGKNLCFIHTLGQIGDSVQLSNTTN